MIAHPHGWTLPRRHDLAARCIAQGSRRASGRYHEGMKYLVLPLCLLCLLIAQIAGQDTKRLPSGKLWVDEISRADHEGNLEDAKELAELSAEIQKDLEDGEWYVLSLETLKKVEKAEELAKHIKDRLRRN